MANIATKTNPVVLKPGMRIGSASAEEDHEFLLSCFVNYPPLEQCMDVNSRGTVVDGRTGSGKTAILKYISSRADHSLEIDPLDMSMSYVSNSDVLSFLYTIGADLDLMFQVLWKHVLCIEFIRLRFSVKNEEGSKGIFSWLFERFSNDARKRKAIEYLRNWEGKFWITMDQNIKELTEKVESAVKAEMGGELDKHIAKFKAGGQYDKRMSVDKKSELIARTKKIINSEQLSELGSVIDMLAEVEGDTMRTYYILIDKLDTNWVDVSVRFKMIRGLVESLKSFKRIRDLKILVALRSDVLERVVQETRDLTFQREKLDDYFVHIKWNKDLLRQLVEMRISRLFQKHYSQTQAIKFTEIFPHRVGSADPFDYMIERTLMRPRDIITFVNECLEEAQGNYEVSATSIKRAEVVYSAKRRDSIEQEWQSAFPTIKKLLLLMVNKGKSVMAISELCTAKEMDDLALAIYSEEQVGRDPLFEAAKAHCDDGPSNAMRKLIASILYRVGVIGVKLQKGTRYQFAHLDHPLLPISQIPEDDDLQIRIHPMLHATLRVSGAG